MNKERLQWLDALRGFTMLLVVANHVYLVSFDTSTKASMFMSLCLLFRMPLFFFISGFLAYKASFSWNVADTARLVQKKLRVQLVPTLVMMTAWIALFRKPFWQAMETAWLSPTKQGYWFTIVLLEMLLAYYAVCFLASRLNRLRFFRGITTNRAVAAVWLLAFVGYATMYMPKWFNWYKDIFWHVTSLTEFVRFFHFFLLGNLCHRHWNRICRLLDSSWFFPLLVVIAFIGSTDYLHWHTLRLHWANLPRTLAMYSLVLMCVAFFRCYENWFSRERIAGRALQYVGVRTLDVYLLHYFFLPHLPAVGAWFKANPHNFALEGTAALLVAFLVVAFALLTSNILRVSPFLKKWLFGR